MYLTNPDTLTITPLGTAVTHPVTRTPLGRRSATSVVVKGQIEPSLDRKVMGDDGTINRAAGGEVVFCPRLCRAKGYTPTAGDRITAILWAETGLTDTVALYLDDVKMDAAGALIRCAIVDKEPERRPA